MFRNIKVTVDPHQVSGLFRWTWSPRSGGFPSFGYRTSLCASSRRAPSPTPTNFGFFSIPWRSTDRVSSSFSSVSLHSEDLSLHR